MATLFEPIRPGAADHDDFHCGSVRQETKKEKFSDRAPPRSGIPARLAQNGVCDRDTFASHEANAPILTPDIPAMIAAATMALTATQTPQRRSALR
jgi:hypothetical protein